MCSYYKVLPVFLYAWKGRFPHRMWEEEERETDKEEKEKGNKKNKTGNTTVETVMQRTT